MKFKKKTVFAGVIVFLGLLIALPATRDELDWYWADSRGQAADYLRYLGDWPKGRHALEARFQFQQRTRKDSTKALISQAIKENSEAQSDTDVRQERQQRVERFLWKQVTNEDTLIAYRNYLQRYPTGEFAAQARRRIQDLDRLPAPGAAVTNSPGR